MWVNPDIAPFNDAHVRRAVQLGIDRSALVAAGEMGLTEPALGPLAKGTWYYDPSIETSGFYGPTANIDAAKQELALSTLPKPVKFKMTYPNEAPWSTIAPLVQSQLQAVGFEVEMDGRDFGSVLDDMFAGNFQALHMDFSGKIDPALSLGRFYPCTGGYVKYCDPQVDNLLNQAAASSDLTERTQLYAQIQKIVNEDAAPIILFYYTNDIKAMRSNVMGYQNLGVQRQPMFNVWLKP
jgi:peptide/nickel transport system substrate-binding protein